MDWLAELGSRFQLEQSTVHVAVSMIIRSCGSVFLVDCLFVDWLVGWLVGWLVCWLVSWLVGWLVGWLVAMLAS